MPSEPTEATLAELETQLEEEDELYGSLLAELDRLSENPAPYERDPELPELLGRLNEAEALRTPPERSRPTGVKGFLNRLGRKLLAPELAAAERALAERRAFDSTLVQYLNRFSEGTNAAAARSAELASMLVRFAQRIDRLADAKDRLYSSMGNRRADLVMAAMDKRLEMVRLGLARAEARLEGLDSAVAIARSETSALASGDCPPAPLEPGRLDEAHYVAFEERYRGSSEELRERLKSYLPVFEDRSPVIELGCGRGEFLSLLKEAGLDAIGVDGNREMVGSCRDKGVSAELGDAVSFLASREDASAGGVFAAQLVEHLPPPAISRLLEEAFRVLRPGGRLVLETVNPRSVIALVEAFYRDLSHEKPIHPETLEFLMRAAGFRDVTVRYQSPVAERLRLLSVLSTDEESTRTLNQNFDKLNALLFGDMDYAAIATKV